MDAITLRYSVQQTTRQQEHEPVVSDETLRVSLTDRTIIIERDNHARLVDFETRRTTALDRTHRTLREGSLFGYVHDRASALGSMLHAIDVATAGGAEAEGHASVEASYGLSWPGGGDEERRFETELDQGRRSWWVEGVRVASVTPRPGAIDLPRRGILRLCAFGLGLHPEIGATLAGDKILPQNLTTERRSIIFSEQETREYTLEAVEDAAVDFASLAEGYASTPPSDPFLARRGAPSSQRASDFRVEDARGALEAGRLVEALLAVFAHSWAHVEKTASLVAAIFDRAGWLNPVKKLLNNVEHASTEDGVRDQIHQLEKLRRKAGSYDYALDVLIGEKHAFLGEHAEARVLFGRALERDPGLAATWISAGRTYPSALQFQDAWDCFDEGDRLCPQHPVVGDIQQLSTRLRADHPQLF